ncbi:hypothetical protein OIO90_003327 [Microbotryomycetes sp. JL221]|nr:hypothetical protein OIO90_003327 [Microbotryomycetes sp. JL221]
MLPHKPPIDDNESAYTLESVNPIANSTHSRQDDNGITSAINFGPSTNYRPTPSYAQSQYETVVRRQRVRSDSNPLKIPHRVLYPSVRQQHPYLNVNEGEQSSGQTTPSIGGQQDRFASVTETTSRRTFQEFQTAPWGSMSFETITEEQLKQARLVRNDRRKQQGEGSLGPWLASGVAGVAVAGSPLYAFPAVVKVAGIYSPISLLVATLLLTLWRPIMVELGHVIPLDGGNYVYLINSCSKTVAIIGAVLTLLDDVCTSIVSAGTAASYIAAEIGKAGSSATDIGLTIALLLTLTVVGLLGIKGSAETMTSILMFHLLTVAIVVISAAVRWGQQGNAIIAANWDDSAPGSPATIAKQVFLGVCVAFLGVTGIESAPDYRASVREGAYPIVVRSLQWIAIVINAPLMLVTFGVLPLSDILDNQSVVSTVANVSAGSWLRVWTAIDSVLILSATILTGVVSSNALVGRMASDNILPSLFLKRLPRTGSPYVALGFFAVVSLVIYASTSCNLVTMSNIFAIVFLSIMLLFPVTCVLLSYNRPRLPRLSRTSLSLNFVVLALSLTLILGNIVVSPIIVAYLTAYTAVLTVVTLCVCRRSKVLEIVYWITEQSQWMRSKKQLQRKLAHWVKQTRTSVIVLFVDGDEIHRLHDMLVYVRENEETDLVKVVHCYPAIETIPSELEANCKLLDEALPSITVDLILLQAEFSPRIVDAYTHKLGIDASKCFIGSLSPQSRYNLSEFAGVRVIAA